MNMEDAPSPECLMNPDSLQDWRRYIYPDINQQIEALDMIQELCPVIDELFVQSGPSSIVQNPPSNIISYLNAVSAELADNITLVINSNSTFTISVSLDEIYNDLMVLHAGGAVGRRTIIIASLREPDLVIKERYVRHGTRLKEGELLTKIHAKGQFLCLSLFRLYAELPPGCPPPLQKTQGPAWLHKPWEYALLRFAPNGAMHLPDIEDMCFCHCLLDPGIVTPSLLHERLRASVFLADFDCGYDMESLSPKDRADVDFVFWCMVWWLIQAQPAGSKGDKLHLSDWLDLVGLKISDTTITLSHAPFTLHSVYADISSLLESMREHLRIDPGSSKDDIRSKDPDTCRLILNVLVENKSAKYLRLPKDVTWHETGDMFWGANGSTASSTTSHCSATSETKAGIYLTPSLSESSLFN
ncbi:hypothetical protein PIIN_00548 [Serendipita indica DSM 11827]|uniref:Fungal-type protein kinase domain-containing protein n=1 Tax=Serendipita indica (strain DSM 11827) TaxID=1109443 RepID=G4U2R5_SERID|nr:hypothetical protein PIIN_00548 [Serendipita indica DSM 11827]